MTKGDEPIPTFVMVIFGILYNIGGAGLMMCFEKWNFIKANYFSFVSLMTIGFGDVVPAGDEQNYNQTRGMVRLGSSFDSRSTEYLFLAEPNHRQCLHHYRSGRGGRVRERDHGQRDNEHSFPSA
jgi:hypothetical protein